MFLDAIHYRVRSEGQIVKEAVYIAIGISLDGRKDVLGMWVGENESAKFWATVLNGLRNLGCIFGALEQETSEDIPVPAGQMGQSEHLFQVPSGSSAVDLYHQCH